MIFNEEMVGGRERMTTDEERVHSGRWCRHNLATVCDGKFWRHLVMPVQPHIYLLIPCCFIFRYVVVMYSLLLFDVLRYFCVKLLINSTITVVVSRFLC